MARPSIYDASGRAVVLARPVGFNRPVEMQDYTEPGGDVSATPQHPPAQWWEGPQHIGEVPLRGRRR